MKGYKFIQRNMKSKNGNIKWKLGKWISEEELEICVKGLHASQTPLQSLDYVYGSRWFVVEAKGKIIRDNNKFVANRMRLVKELPVKRIVVEFVCKCARRVLKNYEKEYPDDKKPYEAIKAAEDYMDGKIKLKELKAKCTAARSAARSAAWSAESAVWSAAWSVESAESAESAAWSAESAAWSAESAESAAWSAESAAWSAESAAWSAESAAWSAESAAWSAELKWQEKKLKQIVKKYEV